MSTKISKLQDDQFLVNGKLVYRDQNGNWVAGEELLPSEARAFRQHLQSLERGFDSAQPPQVEPEPGVTYKV